MRKLYISVLIVFMLSTSVVSAESWTYEGYYRLTGYCACTKCCGKSDGITASGKKATQGVTVSASKEFPLGTRLYIEGVGYRTVQDRGGSIKGKKLDVFCSSHKACYAANINRKAKVWVIK